MMQGRDGPPDDDLPIEAHATPEVAPARTAEPAPAARPAAADLALRARPPRTQVARRRGTRLVTGGDVRIVYWQARLHALMVGRYKQVPAVPADPFGEPAAAEGNAASGLAALAGEVRALRAAREREAVLVETLLEEMRVLKQTLGSRADPTLPAASPPADGAVPASPLRRPQMEAPRVAPPAAPLPAFAPPAAPRLAPTATDPAPLPSVTLPAQPPRPARPWWDVVGHLLELLGLGGGRP
jgi:hypothetical protein